MRMAVQPTEWTIEPDPAGCCVEPRDQAFFAPFVVSDYTPRVSIKPEPGPLPDGVPADAPTVEEVLAVLRQHAACYHAGERLRFFALFTDGFLRRQYGPRPMYKSDFQNLAGPPTPIPLDPSLPPRTMSDPRELPDGRVAAVSRIYYKSHLGTGVLISVVVLVREGGRLLIDEMYPLAGAGRYKRTGGVAPGSAGH